MRALELRDRTSLGISAAVCTWNCFASSLAASQSNDLDALLIAAPTLTFAAIAVLAAARRGGEALVAAMSLWFYWDSWGLALFLGGLA